MAAALAGTLIATSTACIPPSDSPATSLPTGRSSGPSEGPAAAPDGVRFIDDSLARHDGVLTVYEDFGDNDGVFTQRAWMGLAVPGADPAPDPMSEDAAGHTGTSGIEATADLTRFDWAGYMFVNGVLEAGSESPQLDVGEHDAGLDLAGATRVTFWAKGRHGGERVEFGFAGVGWDESGVANVPYPDSARRISSGAIELGAEWEEHTIDLRGADLSRVACGFTWVASAAGNPSADEVAFSIDEIRVEFDQATPRPMFLRSYAPVALDQEEAFINNFAYTYDNAVAILALSHAGLHERARQMADALVWSQENDRKFTDGRIRNAYASGPPAASPGWFSARDQTFARMPGFWDVESNVWLEDYYADSTSTGNVAWALLALAEVARNAPDQPEYAAAALRLADFALTLRTANGFAGGYEGFDSDQEQATYLSTEHNLDLIPAFAAAAELTDDASKAAAYTAASGHARAFVLTMAARAGPFFATGTKADGVTPNKTVTPLDAQTWAVLALGPDGVPGGLAGARELIAEAEDAFGVGLDGGVDFNTDQDGVWLEGTAQLAVVDGVLGDEDGRDRLLKYLSSLTAADGSLPAAASDGVTTGFDVAGTSQPWLYHRRTHLGATAWGVFATLGVNPLDVDG